MWRSIVFIVAGLPLGLGGWVITWLITKDFRSGLIAMAIIMTASMALALANLFFIKKLSTPDIFLPIPFALVWSVVLFPFGITSEYFNIASFLGSSILLTLSLWWVREGKMKPGWIIFPALVYLYEMIPVNIPGPFDDIFGFGGSVTALIIQGIKYRSLRLLHRDEPKIIEGKIITQKSSGRRKKKGGSKTSKAIVVRTK
ncbi:MAG: hypothetical protein JNM63_18850 [Spirochaetia bacterium]|nr:hypothetical protein [Spirochaetia bacterium]